ncbi:hypothetical protein HPP92_001802 [Vanilla planifolia]|uniref:Uncharacterized protein n=1 Tax=Vanilla planifolia TaxID=51239 RepID=A0A835VLR2_VANPL|nr:hypothetical protein HPP92_001802 [Vanilla planifolia]
MMRKTRFFFLYAGFLKSKNHYRTDSLRFKAEMGFGFPCALKGNQVPDPFSCPLWSCCSVIMLAFNKSKEMGPFCLSSFRTAKDGKQTNLSLIGISKMCTT